MNVSLTPELESYVVAKVKSGRYRSANEVLREALRLHEEQDRLRTMRLRQVEARVAEGLAQLDRGEVSRLDIEAIKAKRRRRRHETA
ncbi:MAG: type II toxin-antitoxin system ParD family antitoxin [Deltaproteobacteria bacterium]|nr:type II toxin-antitoxin system ParD family antitoxin [Deltaproteobacteria bacterium]